MVKLQKMASVVLATQASVQASVTQKSVEPVDIVEKKVAAAEAGNSDIPIEIIARHNYFSYRFSVNSQSDAKPPSCISRAVDAVARRNIPNGTVECNMKVEHFSPSAKRFFEKRVELAVSCGNKSDSRCEAPKKYIYHCVMHYLQPS